MVVLDGASLTIDSLAAVAEGREEVSLAPGARDRMAAARGVVEEAQRLNVPVYGLTTALAERKTVALVFVCFRYPTLYPKSKAVSTLRKKAHFISSILRSECRKTKSEGFQQSPIS